MASVESLPTIRSAWVCPNVPDETVCFVKVLAFKFADAEFSSEDAGFNARLEPVFPKESVTEEAFLRRACMRRKKLSEFEDSAPLKLTTVVRTKRKRQRKRNRRNTVLGKDSLPPLDVFGIVEFLRNESR